jgi:hypothetical protein
VVKILARETTSAECGPFRKKADPQPGTVERFDDRNRVRAGGQQDQQQVQRLARPRRRKFRRRIGQSAQRVHRNGQSGARRGRSHSQYQHGIVLRSGVAGQHNLAVVLDHSLV